MHALLLALLLEFLLSFSSLGPVPGRPVHNVLLLLLQEYIYLHETLLDVDGRADV